jgi:hypothetical protein
METRRRLAEKQVDQEPPPRRTEQVRVTHRSEGLGAGPVALGYSGFLTSKLVLAFFNTSWFLVTETIKQPPKQKLRAGLYLPDICIL